MYKTLVKIILQLFIFEHCKLYENDVIQRFEELIYSFLDNSSDFEDFRNRILNNSICLPIHSWKMVRDFIHYLDNFGMDDKM